VWSPLSLPTVRRIPGVANGIDGDMSEVAEPASLASRHARIGWLTVLVFTLLGLVLEALHGLKVPLYVDVEVENRRLLFTLAHAHGTLLGLLHLALAATAGQLAAGSARSLASRALTAATVVLPGGFFLGGVWLSGTDPGLGVFLVPVGGALLVAAVAGATVAAWSSTR